MKPQLFLFPRGSHYPAGWPLHPNPLRRWYPFTRAFEIKLKFHLDCMYFLREGQRGQINKLWGFGGARIGWTGDEAGTMVRLYWYPDNWRAEYNNIRQKLAIADVPTGANLRLFVYWQPDSVGLTVRSDTPGQSIWQPGETVRSEPCYLLYKPYDPELITSQTGVALLPVHANGGWLRGPYFGGREAAPQPVSFTMGWTPLSRLH